MKSTTKFKLTIQICFLFIFSAIQSQTNVSKSDLLGEWYYKISNDTIILEKKTANEKQYEKWIFNEADEFIAEHRTHKKYDIIGRSKGDKWYFNDTTKQVKIIVSDFHFYKVVSYSKQVVKMIEVKSVKTFSLPSGYREAKPKGMVFIPQGSFMMGNVSVSLEAFWMSNEVTNKEYREFVEDVKFNPNEEMYTIKLFKVAVVDTMGTITEKLVRNVDSVRNSTLLPELTDAVVVEKMNSMYKNYFTDKKYDGYPVVGVSQRSATYYCIWKTKMENDRLKKEGKPEVHSYQLPSEEQWAYVAAQPLADKNVNIGKNVINPSESGMVNDWGLFSFSGNVSEWTSSTPKMRWSKTDTTTTLKNMKIVRGGSWKTKPDIGERKVLDQDAKEDYIGFRIVRTYIGKK